METTGSLIDELIKDYDGPDSFRGESGLFADLKKRIVNRINSLFPETSILKTPDT